MVRTGALILGGLAAAVAVGFALRWSWATDLWPWPDGRYSYLFVASIAAAVGAATIWVFLENDYGVLAPGALNVAVMLAGQSALLFTLHAQRDEQRLLVTAIVLGVAGLVSGVVWWHSRRFAPRDPRPMPPVVRASFGVFVVALVAAGGALLAGADIFPWKLDEDSAAMFGWIFLGDACFFAYGLLSPRWAYAAPQLLAFLAYDLVLLGPFIGLFDDVTEGHELSLAIYTTILVFSAAVAVFFLFVREETRITAGFGNRGHLAVRR